MSELSTIVYQVNFKYIIDNCLDKKMWHKKWKIFEYDNKSLELYLYSINLSENQLVLVIREVGTLYRSSSFSLPLSEDHFNEQVFYQKLFSAIHSVIVASEVNFIKQTESYLAAVQMDEEFRDSLEQRAKERLDVLDIKDTEIRELYIDDYINSKSSSFASGFVDKMKYHYFTPLYYMLCYQFEKLSNKYANNLLDQLDTVSVENRDKIINKVKLAFEKIDLYDMVDDDVNRINDVLSLDVDDE